MAGFDRFEGGSNENHLAARHSCSRCLARLSPWFVGCPSPRTVSDPGDQDHRAESGRGLPDTLSRIIARRLQERLGQPVVIENRPGANAGIGTAALTTSTPDGYTFLMTDSAVFAISPLIYLKLPYNPK